MLLSINSNLVCIMFCFPCGGKGQVAETVLPIILEFTLPRAPDEYRTEIAAVRFCFVFNIVSISCLQVYIYVSSKTQGSVALNIFIMNREIFLDIILKIK